jgi:hypothetical protein
VTRTWPALIPDAQRLLDAFEYVQIDEDVVRSAIVEPDRLLRSLDAIHLATARIFGPELTALLTYDDRRAKAAADAGDFCPGAARYLNGFRSPLGVCGCRRDDGGPFHGTRN